MEIHRAVRDMLRIVEALHKQHPKKRFTLDGRLVGDLVAFPVHQCRAYNAAARDACCLRFFRMWERQDSIAISRRPFRQAR